MADRNIRVGDGKVSGVRKDMLIVTLLAFFTLVVLGPFMTIGLASDPSQLDGGGTQIRQISYIAAAGLLLFSLRATSDYRRALAIPIPLLIGLAWCWLSLVWAVEPGIALRRLILTTVVMWTLFAAVRNMAFEEVTNLLRIVLLILLAVNYIAVAVAPQYAIHLEDTPDERGLIGDWRGIMQHKNLAGATTAITMILFAFDANRFKPWMRIGIIAASIIFLVFSGSKTSLGMGLAALVVGWVYLQFAGRNRIILIILISILAVGATVVGLMFRDPLNIDMSDPKAFTGRPLIWKAMLGYIGDHPLLGAGYGSFWNIGPTSPVYHYASNWATRMATGHNGFLDLATQLGIIGLVLIVAVAVVIPVVRFAAAQRGTTGQPGALLIALFLFCIGHNMTESSIFERDQFVWVVLMMAIGLTENVAAASRYSGGGFDLSRVKRRAAT